MRRRIKKTPAEKAAIFEEKAPIRSEPTQKTSKKLVRSRSLKQTVRVLSLQMRAMHLKAQGWQTQEIADELGVERIQVSSLIVEGLEEYYAERDEAARRYLALADARYDRIFRTWLPRAEGFVEIVTGEDGVEMEVVHPPDPEATRLCLVAQRDAARMYGLNKLRVEHTGANGGPIAHNIDWSSLTDEQIQRFKQGDLSVLHAAQPLAIAGAGGRGTASTPDSEDGETTQHH